MRHFIYMLAALLVLTGCSRKIETRMAVQARTNAFDQCLAGTKAYPGVQADVAERYCNCAADKLVATYSLVELKRLEDSGEAAATKALQPIMQQCMEIVVGQTH